MLNMASSLVTKHKIPCVNIVQILVAGIFLTQIMFPILKWSLAHD